MIEKEIKKPLAGGTLDDDSSSYGIYDFSDLFDADILSAVIDEYYGNAAPTEPAATTDPAASATEPETTPKTGSDSTILIYALIAFLALAVGYKKIRSH